MNRNRLLIIISSAVAILGAFLPWASVSAGFFGAMSIRGTQGDGTFIAVLGVIAIVLACLQDNKTALPRNFATGVAVIGALQTLIMLINLLNLSRVLPRADYERFIAQAPAPPGAEFFSAPPAGFATAVFGAMALSGGKLSKDTLTEVMDASKNLSKTVAQATTTVVKSASEEINKQSEKLKEAKEAKAAEAAQAESAATGTAALPESTPPAPEEPEVPTAENGTEEPPVSDSTSDNSAL